MVYRIAVMCKKYDNIRVYKLLYMQYYVVSDMRSVLAYVILVVLITCVYTCIKHYPVRDKGAEIYCYEIETQICFNIFVDNRCYDKISGIGLMSI